MVLSVDTNAGNKVEIEIISSPNTANTINCEFVVDFISGIDSCGFSVGANVGNDIIIENISSSSANMINCDLFVGDISGIDSSVWVVLILMLVMKLWLRILVVLTLMLLIVI